MIDLKSTAIGLEFGSTRIKAVLVDSNGNILANGSHEWENQFVNGIWTYSIDDIKKGLQDCFKNLKDDVTNQYGIKLNTTGAIGLSAMMHGYMVFDKNDQILVPFRTWRNINAEKASNILTEKFSYHIPARWSIAHLYQAIIDKEEHISKIAFQTTLEGYVHYLLTGKKVIGIGEASGMFPIDPKNRSFDKKCVQIFNNLLKENNLSYTLEDIFPTILVAGENAGTLTKEGAKLLDPEGDFEEGVVFCPPEGDAETGMCATNAIRPNTGNISAGTSIFGMIVLDEPLKAVYPEIDLVATPVGDMVAMVHCNNCTSEINNWVNMFDEVLKTFGTNVDKGELFTKLFNVSLEGKADCDGVIVNNYLSGESLTHVDNGRPMVARSTESKFNLANFMKSQIYSSFATLAIGLDILTKEGVKVDKIAGHGGLFKTKGVAQKYLASALNTSVSCMKTAGEGGAWGMALLALFMKENCSLFDFLENKIFKNSEEIIEKPDSEINKGFAAYIEKYKTVLKAESILSKEM